MNTRIFLTSVSALAASAVLGGQAFAQSMDYAAMSDLFGEPVTAGATGAPQRASDVPATMIIITQDEIGRYPEYDIPGILRHFSGMDVTRYSVGDAQVNIRGAATGYSPRLLVLVNGREVYLDSYGYTAWSTIPVQLEEIQQIEVVKGPQAALYGFNAVGGVVNIITRNPQHGEYATMRVNAGTDGYSDASVVAAHQFGDRIAMRVSYGNSTANEFAPFPGGLTVQSLALTDFSRESGAIEARFNITDTVTLTTEATFSTVDQLEMTSVFSAARGLYELRSYKADLEADTSFGFITASAYRNENEILYSFGPLSAEVTTFRIQDLFKIGPNDTVRLGLEARQGQSASFPQPGNGDFGYDSFAASAMWNHKFSNALDVTLAGRFDSVDWSRDAAPDPAFYPFSQSDYSVSFEEISYNAAVVWRPDFGGSVRFATGRGIQAPTMFDIGFTLPFGAIALAGNPNMDTSVVTGYELAYDRALTPTIDLRAAAFHQETKDVRGVFGLFPDLLPPAAPVPTLLFDNRGDTQVTGFELALAGNPEGPWSWDVNYTFQDVADDLEGPFGLGHVQDFESVTPEHLANGHIGWTGERFSADVFVNYVAGHTSPLQPTFGIPTMVEIDAAVSASFRAGYRINDHIAFTVNAQNANHGDGELTNVNTQSESRAWIALAASF
jgi:outer membrane receptor for ferrienterochelin and colicins